ncbi:hypothetical protein E3P81_01676 [Wallemia ichthyophaga]|nr:hypothetical protein E3P97_01677 [Wallemia ichthyophaga]TIB04658.1 hypothetical protein E3P96_01551 [Wallemia ichthyophaga]TIB33435.1 hypothetical protein E3P85_01329 [Wallemia ichthyophaga]TIB47473.1 hypothetical protein E3P82_01675 [Wallemia ichthyophaga]TIB51813.1 hypothetical protein E3P81_01676 [Wallemia ichthyophaga]
MISVESLNLNDFSGDLNGAVDALLKAESTEDSKHHAEILAATLDKAGVRYLSDVVQKLLKSATNKKSGDERQSACIAFLSLFKRAKVHGGLEVFYIGTLPTLLDLVADKGEAVKDAAQSAIDALISLVNPYSITSLLENIWSLTSSSSAKWKSKSMALQIITKLVKSGGPLWRGRFAEHLGEIVPHLEAAMHDTKSEVSSAAKKCSMAVCSLLQNPDILPHVPSLVSAMQSSTAVPALIKQLSSTTFVAEVDGPCLAVLVPLLGRALKEKSMETIRMTVIVIGNLVKLVRDPRVAARYLGDLFPGVTNIKEGAAFPEVRAFAATTHKIMVSAGASSSNPEASRSRPEEVIHACEVFNRLLTAEGVTTVVAAPKIEEDDLIAITLKYISDMIVDLAYDRDFERSKWVDLTIAPYLQHFLQGKRDEANKVAQETLDVFLEIDKKANASTLNEYEDDGEELCRTDFSLAYGGLLLLNHTTLRIVRGRRYGICAGNGKGKSTLLKALRDGKVEGFPTQDQLRTIMVEHALQGEDASLSIGDYVASDPNLKGLAREKITEALESVGFSQEKQNDPVGSLSGGWKMKLELGRAMCIGADVLLLDEPTNHLDVPSVQWLENWLVENNTTILTVSHDSGFLDAVCTDIMHYEDRRLVYYKGNLSAFVAQVPAAQAYYTLEATSIKFSFPPPGSLMGVRSNTRAIMKLKDCVFAYPNTPRPQLNGVSCALSLSSRVGILGPNGAGKSTLIKLITGETVPQTGSVYKHPNLRVGYVAQHAFHHIEQHLEKTPIGYIQWRYAQGYDREVLEKETRVLTDEDKKMFDTPIVGKTGEARYLERIMGRQKLKKSYQYDVKWKGLPHKMNVWLPRELLIDSGFSKLVQQFDDFEASREGAGQRDNKAELIRKMLEDLGLDGDIAQYNEISGLSGGQKVKVVVAAAMYNNPQILILDEPTNFLDRESVGGLATAINTWTGAVCVISHNLEFVHAVCPEIWNVDAGVLSIEGKAAEIEDAPEEKKGPKPGSKAASRAASAAASAANSAATSATEDSGSSVPKPKKKKKMSRNEVKAQEERRRQRTLRFLSDSTINEREPDTESD